MLEEYSEKLVSFCFVNVKLSLQLLLILASKNTNFIPSVVAIISFAISRASKKLLVADCVHWITDLCTLSEMQKTGEILRVEDPFLPWGRLECA